jgi:hypothetical protein
MSYLMKICPVVLLLLLTGGFAALALAGGAPKPPAMPAKIEVDVAPEEVAPGGRAQVTVKLEPIAGVRINRYPQITLKVAARDGLVRAGEVTVGNTTPPPPDKMSTNYFETVDPLKLDLDLDESAPPGSHKVAGQLIYYYCVKASGFCAPKKTSVEIPIEVR